MKKDYAVLAAALMAADRQGLGSMTLLDGSDDVPGIEGECDVVEVLATGALWSVSRPGDLPWIQAAVDVGGVGAVGAHQARALVRALGRMTLEGDGVAAARLAWRLCGGCASDFRGESRRVVWVAGPAGLACWGGEWERDENNGYERVVMEDSWDAILERLEEDE